MSRRSNAPWICLLFTIPALAHMEISWPYPLRSKFNPDNNSNNIDYSMTSPLKADGSNFPCKGYQNDNGIQTTADYTAGSTYNMTLAGSATHHGGSCQISLSYDKASFRVIKSMIGGCPLTSIYEFTIPSFAPSGDALLAWTWQNEEGNREYYMNCAAIKIASSNTRRQRKRTSNDFASLPNLWKANLASVNSCKTVEGEDPVYPDPGTDVLYSGDMSESSPTTSGDCDSSTSTDTEDSGAAPNFYTGETSPQDSISTEDGSRGTIEEPSSETTSPSQTTPAPIYASILSLSPTTTTIPNENTISTTLITTPTASTQPSGTPLYTNSTLPPESPPYDSGNSTLPCVPGTFICINASIFLTCTVSSTYLYPRPVAAGMQCLPSYSPSSNSTAQQANVPEGFYRDDQIVRARPDGGCEDEGTLICTDAGQQFEVCNHGGWVKMGSVAAGTVCRDGEIVAAS